MTSVTTTQSVPLAERTTLRLGGPAARFVHATTAAELVEAVRTADAATDEKVLVLGGGSNLVISDGRIRDEIELGRREVHDTTPLVSRLAELGL